VLALLLNRSWVRWRAAYRFAFVSTHLVGFVFAAVLFAQLLSPRSGLVNRAIGALIGQPVQVNWLGDPRLALPAMLLAGVWLSVGFGMIYLLAALQSTASCTRPPRSMARAAGRSSGT
jgi:multiple sugar transport system permease protein